MLGFPKRLIVKSTVQKTFTSYGIIAFSRETKRFLVVKRQYSPEFTAFIRGNYRISEIENIYKGFTGEEIQMILDCEDGKLNFEDMYYKVLDDSHKSFEDKNESLRYSQKRFEDYLLTIGAKNSLPNIEVVNTNQWIFPKGRKLHFESPLECAKREFKEETGVDVSGQILDNCFSVELKGYNGNIYQTYLYLMILEDEPQTETLENIKPQEIGYRAWMSTPEIYKNISSHLLEVFDRVLKLFDKELT